MSYPIDIDILKTGCVKEFRKFYKYYKPKVRGLINFYGYHLTHDEVEDIIQDTFSKAYRGLKKCRAEKENSLFAWLGTTLRNATYDYVKKKNRYDIIDNKAITAYKEEPIKEESDTSEIYMEQSIHDDLFDILKTTFNGVLLYEKAILGKTNKELSQKYDCSASAISQRILREKKRLASIKEVQSLFEFTKAS